MNKNIRLNDNEFVFQHIKYTDLDEIITFLAENLIHEQPNIILSQLINSKIDFDKSWKIIDKKTHKIYGVLILCNFMITQGTPLSMVKPHLANYLSKLQHVNGYAFVIDKTLRGKKFDIQLLHKCLTNISSYDYIWCGVDTNLKSHNYWKKLGFIEICKIQEATFYLYPIKKNILIDIFIIEMMSQIYEKNNY
mgnify:CR=1 FL=1